MKKSLKNHSEEELITRTKLKESESEEQFGEESIRSGTNLQNLIES